MRKTIILALVFLALVGGAILALTLSSKGGGSGPVLGDASIVDSLTTRVIDGWSQAKGWDKDLYAAFRNEIQMGRSAGLLTIGQEDQLLHLNCARASLVIVPLAEREFKKADASRSVIAKCSDGLSTLKKDGFSNADTKKMAACCNVYFQILRLVESDGPSGFRGSDGGVDWTDYRDYVSEQEEKVKSFQSDGTYKAYLSHITVLKQGLADRMTVVRNGAKPYYAGVNRDFKEYFNARPGVDGAILASAARRFREQVSAFPGCSSLAAEMDRFIATYQ